MGTEPALRSGATLGSDRVHPLPCEGKRPNDYNALTGRGGNGYRLAYPSQPAGERVCRTHVRLAQLSFALGGGRRADADDQLVVQRRHGCYAASLAGVGIVARGAL